MRRSHQHESEHADLGAWIADLQSHAVSHLEPIDRLSDRNSCGSTRADDRYGPVSASGAVSAAGK